MDSIILAKSKLPIDFINYIYANFNARIADKILEGISQTRHTSIRVNTLKSKNAEIEEWLNKNKIKYKNVEWYKDAYIIFDKTEKDLLASPLTTDGKIYLQSLSSMVPPIVLEPKENELLLDMTAAPGSKTTQIAALSNNKSKIYANEIDKIRVERLKYNIEKQGAAVVEVLNQDGVELGNIFEQKFDKVLLDTPCSGEGRFQLSMPATYASWSTKFIENLNELQFKLLESAYKTLKIGGLLVYSTCTLNKIENEKVVDYAIKKLNMIPEKINLKIPGAMKADGKGFDKEVSNAIKLIPNEEVEGFFIAKLIKQ